MARWRRCSRTASPSPLRTVVEVLGHRRGPPIADTDGDGFWDHEDKYLGDMMLHVNINWLNLWEKINGGDVHNIFFALTYYDEVTDSTVTLSTERLIDVWTHQDFPNNYYIQVDDTGTSKSFTFMAIADNAGTFGDDILLDCEATGFDKCEYYLTYYYSSGKTNFAAKAELNGQNDMNPNVRSAST